jgi:dihydropyrimidinase
MLDGAMRAKAGDGKYIERPPFPAVHVANSTWRELSAPKGVQRLEVTP